MPRSEVLNIDRYLKPRMSDNQFQLMSEHPSQSQSMMTNETVPSQVSPNDDINNQKIQYTQMPLHEAISNLNLKHQISSTSAGIVHLPNSEAQYPQRSTKSSPSLSPEKETEKRDFYQPPLNVTLTGSKNQPIQELSVDLQLQNYGTLYGAIMNDQMSLQVAIDDWIEQYKINRDEALLVLMQFFINVGGCKGVITSDMYQNMKHAAIICKMTEDEQNGEYFFFISVIQLNKFQSKFCEFIDHFVKQCQYSIIYDKYLMDNVISVLIGLSDSQVKEFRHTATLAATKFMTALLDVALIVSVNLDNIQRQYEAECQKVLDKIAIDRQKSLMDKRQKLEENMDEIQNMLSSMFESLFVYRYRDDIPAIRAICMAEIGVWVKKFHLNFLDDLYFKYIGWTVPDKVGRMRLKCLQEPLHASEDLKSEFKLFTNKFKDKIIPMILDEEYNFAVQAIRLVLNIFKYHCDILSDKDCKHVYELVYSSHRTVAQAAGEILNERLFKPVENRKTVRTKNGKKQLPNTPLIRNLIKFYIESELSEHGAYLVDSLININEMMKDWECMTDLLLEEPGLSEERMDDRQEASLIELMVCCIKQAATGEVPVGPGLKNKIVSAKVIKQVHDDKQRLTEHFVKVLSQLIDTYRTKDTVVQLNYLVSIPHYFDLDTYNSKKTNSYLFHQLTYIEDTLIKHNKHFETLMSCNKSRGILLSNYEPTSFTRYWALRRIVTFKDDNINYKHREAMDAWNNLIEGKEKPNDDVIHAIEETSMKKISIFYPFHILGLSSKLLPEEAIRYSISAYMFATMQELSSIENILENGHNEDIEEQVMRVKTKLIDFMDALHGILIHSSNPLFKKEACTSICEFLEKCCFQLGIQHYPVLGDLIYDSDIELQNPLNDYIQKNAFDNQDKTYTYEEVYDLLKCYGTLIWFGMIPVTSAANIFKYCNCQGSFNSNSLINCSSIDHIIRQVWKINKMFCARTMGVSLIILFKELLLKENIRCKLRTLESVRRHFGKYFDDEDDAHETSEALAALHSEGVLFAASTNDGIVQDDLSVPPPNIEFLEILVELSHKLLKPHKRIVHTYLDKHITPPVPVSDMGLWSSWFKYKYSLMTKYEQAKFRKQYY